MALFYIIILSISSYFALTTVALVSDRAANICIKMYDIADYSIDNHRSMWVAVTVALIIFYCKLWFSI